MFTQLSTEPHVRNEKKEQQQQQKQQQQQNMQGDWDTAHIKRKTYPLLICFYTISIHNIMKSLKSF